MVQFLFQLLFAFLGVFVKHHAPLDSNAVKFFFQPVR